MSSLTDQLDITHVNDIPIHTIPEIEQYIKKARDNKETTIKIGFSTIQRQALHPQLGVPQLYHDQMNVIGKHLYEISNSPEWSKAVEEELVLPVEEDKADKLSKLQKKKVRKHELWLRMNDLPSWYKIAAIKKRRKLTRRYLMAQDGWEDQKQSEFKQLNQYEAQGMLGAPCSLPKGANLLPLIWTYLIKDD